MPNEIDSTVAVASKPSPKNKAPKLPTSSKKRKAAPNAYPPPPPPPPPPVNNPYYQKFFKDYWEKYGAGFQATPVPHGRSGGATAVPTLPPMVMPPPAKKVPATRIPNSLPQEEYPIKTDRETYVLGTADDMIHLSEKQCYTRSRLCEIFIANEEDTTKHVRGRKAQFIGQVGLRCVFCVPGMDPKDRVDRAIVYPTTTKKLYSSVTDMQHYHFNTCPAVPAHVRAAYTSCRSNMNKERKNRDPSLPAPKEYWTRVGEDMGMIDQVADDGSLNSGIKLIDGHKLVARSELPEHKKTLFMPDGTPKEKVEEDSFDKLVAEL